MDEDQEAIERVEMAAEAMRRFGDALIALDWTPPPEPPASD